MAAPATSNLNAPASANPPSTPRLLSIPPELRLKILGLALLSRAGHTKGISTLCLGNNIRDDRGIDHPHQKHSYKLRTLRLTCRQLRDEAMSAIRTAVPLRLYFCLGLDASPIRARLAPWCECPSVLRCARRVVFGHDRRMPGVECVKVGGGDGTPKSWTVLWEAGGFKVEWAPGKAGENMAAREAILLAVKGVLEKREAEDGEWKQCLVAIRRALREGFCDYMGWKR